METTKKPTHTDYVNQWNDKALEQIMDVGSSIVESFKPTEKAEILISMMLNKHVGYKLEYTNLIGKQWEKWVYDNPSFKDKGMLSPRDLKDAIKGFYLRSATGEIQFVDEQKKMLEFVRVYDPKTKKTTYQFMVSEFNENAYKITKAKGKSENSENGIVDDLKKLLSKATTELEKSAIQSAITKLTCVVVKSEVSA